MGGGRGRPPCYLARSRPAPAGRRRAGRAGPAMTREARPWVCRRDPSVLLSDEAPAPATSKPTRATSGVGAVRSADLNRCEPSLSAMATELLKAGGMAALKLGG